jgi:hypothetical protein
VRSTETVDVCFHATKTVDDAFYPELGESCIREQDYGEDLHDPNFQPIRMTDIAGRNLGVLYAYRQKVNGEDALVLAGIEPTMRFYNSVAGKENFLNEVVAALNLIAKHNNLDGVYSVFHGTEESEDGRISQHSSLIDLLRLKYSVADTNEIVPFPSKHKSAKQLAGLIRLD